MDLAVRKCLYLNRTYEILGKPDYDVRKWHLSWHTYDLYLRMFYETGPWSLSPFTAPYLDIHYM